MRKTGTIARGIRLPIINPFDDLATIVTEHVINAASSGGYAIENKDVIGITEAIVAKSQNNFASINDIATDVRTKFDGDPLGLVFPIMSRNRFLNILKGIAMGTEKVNILLSFPQDEVGNPICDLDAFYDNEENVTQTFFTEKEFRATFGELKHPFTGVDYIELYKSVAPNIEIFFSNNPKDILKITPNVLNAEIHKRDVTKKRLLKAGATKVYTLADILSAPINGSGYNAQYGVLGSNISTQDQLKLFPKDCTDFVLQVQQKIKAITTKDVEVFVYGDGAFKDPVCGIWELADPVVSPGFTPGLIGTPNELKLKFLVDKHLSNLEGDAKHEAMIKMIENKNKQENTFAEGTTPRRYTDLLGSLCDLMSGSGDKGTPVIHISGYFDDLSSK